MLFEPDAKLSDSLTYDITAWSLPYAYGLDALASEVLVDAEEGDWSAEPPSSQNIAEGTYAYLADWNSLKDARFLADLLKEGIRVRHARKPFRLNGEQYKRGTLIIMQSDNKHKKDFIDAFKKIVSTHQKLDLETAATGFVEEGKDFGSRDVQMIPKVKVAVVMGEPTSTLRYGEIWHFMEQQLGYPFAALDADYLNRVDLDAYDVLVLPGGNGYRTLLTDEFLGELKTWVRSGGKLIAMGGAIRHLGGDKGFGIRDEKNNSNFNDKEMVSYEATSRERMKNQITGAIFKARVDTTHPLAFGYEDTYFTLKLGADAYEYLPSGTVVYLEENTRAVAGFAGSEAQKKLGKTLLFGVENHGRGKVIYMVDNPLFRGFWENGKLFFANALFMVD